MTPDQEIIDYTYLTLLQLTQGTERKPLEPLFAKLCASIAARTGREAPDVLAEYEARAALLTEGEDAERHWARTRSGSC